MSPAARPAPSHPHPQPRQPSPRNHGDGAAAAGDVGEGREGTRGSSCGGWAQGCLGAWSPAGRPRGGLLPQAEAGRPPALPALTSP